VVFVVVAGVAFGLQDMGVFNCPNKCDKVFDRTQYAINDQPGSSTFEFRSCIIGCNHCGTDLTGGATKSKCFDFCKNFDYASSGIRKGVIEPDKACIMGCIINTCQQICTGGTTDPQITPANSFLWWGLPGSTGCSIKTGLGYVQNPNYGNVDGPSGQGGSAGVAQCCTNALNLCQYNGPQTDNVNFANVVLVAQRSCKKFVGSTEVTDICTFFNNPQNCGQTGLPLTV